MRLFAAINFSPGICKRLLALQSELRAKAVRGSFTPPQNIHLTLVFLGECGQAQLTAAKAAMDAVRYEPFSIEIDRMGCFPRGDGDIWWAGVRESRPLFDLQRQLSEKLAREGFPPDDRSYSPHITLGRKVEGKIVGQRIEPFGEEVTSIELMRSERIQGKLTYTQIYRKVAHPI